MRCSIRVSRCILPWIVTAATTALQGQQAKPVAGVLDVSGKWHLEGQQAPVKAGQKLYAGDKLSTAFYNYDNSITIVRFSDQIRTRIACENSPKNPCRNPVLVNAPEPTSASQIPSIIKAAFDLLVGNPPAVLSHDSSTIGRGYVIAMREDVVNVDGGGGFSLNGRIPILPEGIYSIEAKSIKGKKAIIDAQISTDVEGSWQSSVAVTVPGLYIVTVEDSVGELRANLLILFVDATEYDTAKQTFDAVKNRTDTWQGVNAQTDEDTLLRAILIIMSKSI
ncbi:MAG: hypothetical protein ABR905_10255 [Terracidiphilus sp.]|jgi:hypothetical protein